jgi:hypothetical protein
MWQRTFEQFTSEGLLYNRRVCERLLVQRTTHRLGGGNYAANVKRALEALPQATHLGKCRPQRFGIWFFGSGASVDGLIVLSLQTVAGVVFRECLAHTLALT